MVKLPALPTPAIHAPFLKEVRTVHQGDYYTAEQMQAYGQQCREAALKEAAKVCDAANPHPDQYSPLSEYTEKRVALKLAAEIRSLK